MSALFYSAAAVALIATVLAITRRNAIHALLYLISSLLAVAVVMYTLGAPFAAALEVMVYAGAILVLFVFAVMLMNVASPDARGDERLLAPRHWVGPGLLCALLAAHLLAVLGRLPATTADGEVGPREVGIALFGPYLLAVELASMLLLAGLVSAWYIGRKPR